MTERFVDLIGLSIERDPSAPRVVRVTIDERHKNANMVVHGSVVHALLDTVMGLEAHIARGQRPVGTAEISVRFLRPVFDGTLEARARVIKHGKRLIVVDGEVRREGELVAVGQGTFAALD